MDASLYQVKTRRCLGRRAVMVVPWRRKRDWSTFIYVLRCMHTMHSDLLLSAALAKYSGINMTKTPCVPIVSRHSRYRGSQALAVPYSQVNSVLLPGFTAKEVQRVDAHRYRTNISRLCYRSTLESRSVVRTTLQLHRTLTLTTPTPFGMAHLASVVAEMIASWAAWVKRGQPPRARRKRKIPESVGTKS